MEPQATSHISEPVEHPEKIYVQDDVDEQLLPVFLEEADDLCPRIAMGLRKWREQPRDEQQEKLLKRLLHTLKGSARMAGAMRIGEVVHEMEDRVLAVTTMFDRHEYWDSLESDFDRIAELLEEIRSTKVNVSAIVNIGLQRRATDLPDARPAIERRMSEIGAEHTVPGNILRMRSDEVDLLVSKACEISIFRSRMEAKMRALKDGMLKISGSLERMRKQLQELETPVEGQIRSDTLLSAGGSGQLDSSDIFVRFQQLTHYMNESVHEIHTVQQSLLKNINKTNAAISAQAKVNRELQEQLMSVRLVPFSSISERLHRVVRKTAKALNKRANLELAGMNVELDRGVLEKMTAPLEHLLRNAIVHGLEDEQTRRKNGKNSVGEIGLSLHHENNEIVFELNDDGAGLDFAALRKKVLDKGLLRPDESISDDQLAQIIFVSGVSTAPKVTEMAGRGVGMDVVCSEIAALGGRIDVNSRKSEGTRFTIHLPLTLPAFPSVANRK